MIVSITALAKKVLLTGSPTKFVIAIAQIVQTSYRATTNISESLLREFSTYIVVLMIVETCFVSFKKSIVNSIHIQSLCIHEGFLTYNELLNFEVCMLPSWQLNMLLHSLSIAPVPSQFFPPYAGSGLAHSLCLVCIPPTGLVQILQEFHSLQPPSTNKVLNKNIW